MANNYVITAVCAVVMSRLLYILTNLGEFNSIADVFSMSSGGLVAYGGFLGGFLGSFPYLKYKRIRVLPWMDVGSVAVAAGLSVTRIGCYLFGCDYGEPLDKASAPAWLQKLGTFPRWDAGTLAGGSGSPAWNRHLELGLITDAAEQSQPVHPTQLYESLVGILILVVLLLARRRQRFRGQIFLLFFFSYAVFRFLLEMLRDDPERGTVPPALAPHVLIPLCLLMFAVSYLVSFSKMIETDLLRRATQALAFVPAVVAYVILKPDAQFTSVVAQALSTSQFIAVLSGVGACAAFVVYDKAALAHPQAAMGLGLPEHDRVVDDDDDDGVADSDESAEAAATDDELQEPRKRKKRRKKKQSRQDEP